jgi:hypothetical protein
MNTVGVKENFHVFLTSTLYGNSQPSTPAVLSIGKTPATRWTEGREPNKDGNNDINYIHPFNINEKHVYVHGW